jgi:6-phosphogluconolactonase
MPAELLVVDDPARLVAERLVAATGNVALTGGSGPKPAYELAAELRSDWSGVTFWWSDERCVPPDDERSNYGLARDALLSKVSGFEERRIEGELGGEEAARRYDELLRGVTIDLCLLGIGPDGHTASLFPNAPTLEERERLAVAAEPGLEPFVERVTFTLPAIAACREVLFLVTGESKRDAVDRAFRQPPSPATPSSLARGRHTVAVMDPAAAGS